MAVMQRASKSNRSGYDFLLKVYRESDLSQEKTRILSNDIPFELSRVVAFLQGI